VRLFWQTAPLWKLFVMQLTSYMILLLLIAAIASFALQQIPEGIAIIVIVVVNASIAVYTEKSAANALAALSDMSQPSSTVLRDGETKTIPTKNVVVGDILLVEAGDIIAADAQLVASADLKVNEMPLTGEPTDVTKTHAPGPSDSKALTPPNHLFSGTTVTAGTGLAIVLATGMHTRVGRIAAMLTGEDVERNWLGLKPPKLTPLQHRLKSFGMLLSIAAITAAVIVFFVGAFAREYRDPENAGTFISPRTFGRAACRLLRISRAFC
jgi:magnesium-transporting ATPase (P-type)